MGNKKRISCIAGTCDLERDGKRDLGAVSSSLAVFAATYATILHDKYSPTEGDEKIHAHFVIKGKEQHTLEEWDLLLQTAFGVADIHAIHLQETKKVDGAIRYLIHLDNPEKYQFKPEDVLTNNRALCEKYFAQPHFVKPEIAFPTAKSLLDATPEEIYSKVGPNAVRNMLQSRKILWEESSIEKENEKRLEVIKTDLKEWREAYGKMTNLLKAIYDRAPAVIKKMIEQSGFYPDLTNTFEDLYGKDL